MATNHISETLKKSFSHWTDKQISDLTAHIFAKYGNLNKNDSDAVLVLLNTVIIEAIKTYSVENIGPGLIREMLPQQLFKLKKKEEKDSKIESQGDLKAYTNRESNGKNFDLKKYLEKLERLEKNVLRAYGLTPTEKDLFKFLILVLKREVTTISYQPIYSSNLSTDIMDETLKEIRNSGWQLSDDYFRKLLSTLREKLRNKRDDITGEMLDFIPKEEQDLQEMKELLIDLISFAPKSVTQLKAYRFTEEELEKMMWLKKLFENNGYTFEPNRFPEVYYDDFDTVKDVFTWIESGHEGTPDYLGMYIYNFEKGFIGKPCDKSKEGIIILFKDRIENYCSSSITSIDSVRFVVLMHELGHWLSHWPKKDNYNWRIGFHLPNKHTKEALAQLIAYWSCKDNPIHYQTLLKLTPKIDADPDRMAYLKANKEDLLDDGTVINTEDPYGRYWLLKDKPIIVMLNKLYQLREGWMLIDEKLMEFLISNNDELYLWIKSFKNTEANEYCHHDRNDLIRTSCIYNFSSRFSQTLFPSSGLKLIVELNKASEEWYNI